MNTLRVVPSATLLQIIQNYVCECRFFYNTTEVKIGFHLEQTTTLLLKNMFIIRDPFIYFIVMQDRLQRTYGRRVNVSDLVVRHGYVANSASVIAV